MATELAQFAQYKLKHSSDESFTSPTTVARVSSFNINDSFDVQTVDDFDQAAGEILDQLLGGRTVSINFDANMVLSDAGFVAINDDYKAAKVSYFGIEMADTESSASKWDFQLKGYWSQRNVTGQKPNATVAWTFVASEIVKDEITSGA